MVDAVANVLLESLRDLLVEEVKFLPGVSNKVTKVEADLRTIHGLLMEADSNRARTDSPTLKNCIDELKQLTFKAENVLETYAFEVESKKEGQSLMKKLQWFMGILRESYSVHQVGDEIDDIRSSLADITGRLGSIVGETGSSNSGHQEQRRLLRLRYAHEVDQHFVGMEKDIHSVVSMVNDIESPSVISICGMGGLGKTTLARKIYNHRDVKESFDGCAWVCVTQQFQADTILREILQQIDGNKADKEATHDELVRELHNALVKRKCVIVIDDIWENDNWDILKLAFPSKNCKVVLTTRNQNIASQECHLHELDFLSEDEGWELLAKIALPTINDDATQVLENRSKPFEDIGRQMVKKCGCLPLAISVIGGVLRQKQQILAEWEKVSSNMDSFLRHGGEGIGNDTRVKLVLDLSFDVLPYYLKPCFLYLSCFPEDEEIDTDRLYMLWLGEGLISSEEKGDNETLRDVAERYLTELASRCMVQLKKDDFDYNKFESCRIHDLLRDLCSSKAAEAKFIKRVDISKHEQDIPSAIGASIHRLAINLDVDYVDDRTLRKICMEGLKDLRSFLVIGKGYYEMTTTDFKNIENSKHLRILSLDTAQFEDGNLPITKGKLIYLKYLSLKWSNVKELPQYVCHLPYLQTLDLRVKWGNTIKLPNIISRMKRLRHLFLREDIEVIGGDKLKLDGLNELETLEAINSTNVCIEDIVNLTNLRSLSATFEKEKDSLSKIADYMSSNGCQLRETQLFVESCDLRNVLEKMLMSRSLIYLEIKNCEIGCSFPSYKQGMCRNLLKLKIDISEIEGDVVEVLGKYPMLRFLCLEGKLGEAEKNSEMRFGPNSFPELKYLYLDDVWNLRKWEVEKGAMIKLRELMIVKCRNLEKLPDGLRFISTLERVTCFGMSEEFKDRMRRGENGEGGGQDYANFSHIP